MDVFEAMATRRSVRGFLPDPVPRATVEAILSAASRAPSGSNIQPWKVRVTVGEEKARLSAALRAAPDRARASCAGSSGSRAPPARRA